jgi:zinc protease
VTVPTETRRPGAPAASRLDPRREVLANGLVLLWNESHDSPSVAVRGTFPAGAARESLEQAGLAGLTARLLRRGTPRRDARRISEAVEDLGASFAFSGGTEEAGFSIKCLGRDLGTLLDLVRELLEEPAFAETEVEKTRGELLTALREQEDSTHAQAHQAIYRMLYPERHPYSRSSSGTRETVERLTAEDLRAFHRAYYAADGMKVSIAGALDPDLALTKLGAWFAGRPAAPPMPDWRVEAFGEPQTARIPMAHKSQVDLVIAGPGIPHDHADYYPFWMANVILGGIGLMGRLGERVREQQGMAYSVSCRSISRLWGGEWMATAGVAPENVDRAVELILEEVRRLREGGVTEEELADARDYLTGSVPLRMETNDGIAGYLLNCEYYGMGLDYIYRYPEEIRAQTREMLHAAALRHMDPQRFSMAMAGPLS